MSDFLFPNPFSITGVIFNCKPIIDSHQLWNRHPEWFTNTSLASVNCNRSFVVSGPANVLDELQSRLQASCVMFQRLPVMQAFHSPWIDRAKPSVVREIDDLSLTAWGRFPIYSCIAPGISESSNLPRRFWDALRQPVLFETTLQYIEAEGPRLYIDVGPSGTLAAFAKIAVGNASKSLALPVVDRFGFNERGLKNALVQAAAWRTS